MKFQFEAAFARLTSRLPSALLLAVIGEPARVTEGYTLDPQVQFLLRMQELTGRPGFCEPTPAAGRLRYRKETAAHIRSPTAVGSVRDVFIPTGAQTIRARHYAPANTSSVTLPLLVYFHGGGFVIGDLDTHDEPCRLLCRDAQTHVLSVEYRLAPEHPFPAAVDDSIAALAWAQSNAADLGADHKRVCVGGDSAGANLATVAARDAAVRGRAVAAQLLLYPVLDHEETESRKVFARGYLLEKRDTDAFRQHYTPDPVPTDRAWMVSPLHATELHLLPPTLLVTAGFDPLRDEGQAYARALRAAGVTVHERCEGPLVHGFIHMTAAVPAAARAVREIASEWRALVTPA
jgi:acetyl esterase